MSVIKRNDRKILRGIVVSDKMDKTIVVKIDRAKTHRLYKKSIIVSKKYKADNPDNKAKLGDLVEIMECRPLSKCKAFRLYRIISEKQRAYASATEEAKLIHKQEDEELDELIEKEENKTEDNENQNETETMNETEK